MGNCQGVYENVQTPNPKDPNVNVCSNAIGDTINEDVTRICYTNYRQSRVKGTEESDSGPGPILDYCQSIGTGEEWVYNDKYKKSCCKDDSDSDNRLLTEDNAQCVGTCDGGSCNHIDNNGGSCKRISFTADPTVCCFLDNDCAFKDPTLEYGCYQTTLRQKTCDPVYRDLSSQTCLDQIQPYCTGEKLFLGQDNWWDLWVDDILVDVNSDEVSRVIPEVALVSPYVPDNFKQPTKQQLERKMKQPCLRALARAISKDNQFCTWDSINVNEYRRGNFDPEGLVWAQEVMDAIFDRYTTEFGSFIGSFTKDGKQIDSMIDTFSQICQRFPILCQNKLTEICTNVTNQDIIESAGVTGAPQADVWCGCYMPEDQYSKYTDLFQINRQCTPFCNTEQAIPLVDPDGYPILCLTDVCIIDDLKLNFVRDSGGSDANFNLVCGGCGRSNVKTVVKSGRDFNTTANTIVGIYTQTIFDTQFCTSFSVSRPKDLAAIPFQKASNGKLQATVVAVGQNKNRINVTLRLNGIPQGNNNLVEYSLSFVSASIINPNFKFTNGEKLTLEGYPLDCDIFATTVSTAPTKDGSSNNVFRNHEVVDNECTCILDGSTVNVIDSEFRNFNLTQNCGIPRCTDKQGNQIPCASSSENNNINYVPPSQAVKWDRANQKKQKYNAIGLILFVILIFFIILALGIGLGTSFPPSKMNIK